MARQSEKRNSLRERRKQARKQQQRGSRIVVGILVVLGLSIVGVLLYNSFFLRPIGEARRGNMIEAYHDLLTGDNELARMGAAKAWSGWEARCATLRPNMDVYEQFVDPHVALALARIECHYFLNDCFIEENQILEAMSTLEGIPGIIVHGRYDTVCTLDNAYELHRRWPESELHIVRDAGHVASEPGITDALVRATRRMAVRLGARD